MCTMERMDAIRHRPAPITDSANDQLGSPCVCFAPKMTKPSSMNTTANMHTYCLLLSILHTDAIQKLVCSSYSPSIVTMAVSAAIFEIFNVKEWPDLEIWVWSFKVIEKGAVQ